MSTGDTSMDVRRFMQPCTATLFISFHHHVYSSLPCPRLPHNSDRCDQRRPWPDMGGAEVLALKRSFFFDIGRKEPEFNPCVCVWILSGDYLFVVLYQLNYPPYLIYLCSETRYVVGRCPSSRPYHKPFLNAYRTNRRRADNPDSYRSCPVTVPAGCVREPYRRT